MSNSSFGKQKLVGTVPGSEGVSLFTFAWKEIGDKNCYADEEYKIACTHTPFGPPIKHGSLCYM